MFGITGEAGAQMPLHLSQPIVHGPRREFFVQPVHETADVVHAGVKPESLAYIGAAFFVEVKCDGIGEHRFSGPEIGLQAGGDLKLFDRQFAFLGGGRDFGRTSAF